jgi:hypothetical protein
MSESPKAGELDLSITGAEAFEPGKEPTLSVDVGAKEGLGDGFTLSEDVKVDPLLPGDDTVSVSITKRFQL